MSINLKIHPKSKITELSPSIIALESARAEIRYRNPSTPLFDCIVRLIDPGDRFKSLEAIWDRSDNKESVVDLFFVLKELERHQLLSYIAVGEKGAVATLYPSSGFEWNFYNSLPDRLLLLSRFACLRRDGEKFVLESPLSLARIEIHDSLAFAVLAELAKPVEAKQFVDSAERMSFIELLDQGNFLEKDDPSLKIWEFHDLFFHTRSRQGRTDAAMGGTFRLEGEMDPLPAIRPIENETLIPLSKPHLEALKKTDLTLTETLEKRRSIRQYGTQPISQKELGEFLYRGVQIRTVRRGRYDSLLRTTPSGGGCHPIEIYPLIAHCSGLDKGLYRYHREAHALSLVAPFCDEMASLVCQSEQAMMTDSKIQVCLIFAARFGRTLWKYEAMGYATILKDVGALMQTMYLVATAMDLAPCANGLGNADLFARVSGLDYFIEGSVGEFVIGSKARAECLSSTH